MCLQFAQPLMIQFQFLTPLICLILPLILPLILILYLSILLVAIQRCLGSPLTPQTLCAAIQNCFPVLLTPLQCSLHILICNLFCPVTFVSVPPATGVVVRWAVMAGLLSVGFAVVLLGRQHRLCCPLFDAISTAVLVPEHSMF